MRPASAAASAAALLVIGVSAGCPGRDGPESDRGMTPREPIGQVLERHNERLLAVPGVIGTAIGLCNGDRCIKVFAERMTPEIRERIPSELDGYAVLVEVTGPVRPRPDTSP